MRFSCRPHRSYSQAYYTEYDEQAEMNEMRYAKGDAKDYAQHPHPIKVSSATGLASVRIPSLLLSTSLRSS